MLYFWGMTQSERIKSYERFLVRLNESIWSGDVRTSNKLFKRLTVFCKIGLKGPRLFRDVMIDYLCSDDTLPDRGDK
jgi:hypothetical protein